MAEAFRVLKSGAKLAFAVWATSELSMAYKIIEGALRAHANLDLPIPGGPHPYRFSDPEESARVLLDAGFQKPQSKIVDTMWRLSSADALFQAVSTAGVRMTSILDLQTPEVLDQIRARMKADCAAYGVDGKTEIPMAAVLSWGTKP